MNVNERTVPSSSLERFRPCVPGIWVGQTVTGTLGRRFRVLATDEWVEHSDDTASGPYARLQALDDRQVTVIWPRAWYMAPGQQLELFSMESSS